jgi:Zn ribbon nucleic-acid-binding protein
MANSVKAANTAANANAAVNTNTKLAANANTAANSSMPAATNANKPAAANANKPAAASPTATPAATTTSSGPKVIQDEFILGENPLPKNKAYGIVKFNHVTHATKNYSPDGKSVITCVQCHHTDQPTAALVKPLVTSERDVALTMASWKASPLPVKRCYECHFQKSSPGKKLPVITYSEADGPVKLNNEEGYHRNCNSCHDDAAKLRPSLKTKGTGFATSAGTDCYVCHKQNQ